MTASLAISSRPGEVPNRLWAPEYSTTASSVKMASSGFPSAATGWWESDDVFVVRQEEVGGVTSELLTVTFESDQITLEVRQFFMGLAGQATFTGRLEQ